MKKFPHIFKVSIAMLLCLQMFNVCVYIPAWMYPGNNKADLTESVLELVVESYSEDRDVMYDCTTGDPANTQSMGAEILEDLHPPDEYQMDFALRAHSPIDRNYYHFTPDIKTHVLSVVSPPPDIC